MKNFPCHGCGDRRDPNCTEDCISYGVWAREYFRKKYEDILYIEKMSKLPPEEGGKEFYYEPCDESGAPYRKGDLDDKFKKFRKE